MCLSKHSLYIIDFGFLSFLCVYNKAVNVIDRLITIMYVLFIYMRFCLVMRSKLIGDSSVTSRNLKTELMKFLIDLIFNKGCKKVVVLELRVLYFA